MNVMPEVTVFYACDDRYIPYLAVSLTSLIAHADESTRYRVIVLHSGISAENRAIISAMAKDNITTEFKDVSASLEALADRLCLRDYYSLSIYYRLFIPDLFPAIGRAVYLDADTVLLDDVAALYRTDLHGALVAAAPDMVVASEEIFRRYADEGVGVPYARYFNSGVLVMDLRQMRERDVKGQFVRLLSTYGFDTICPDQDYLNVICRGQVHYLPTGWNRMPVEHPAADHPALVHYNMYFKPWLYADVPYEEHFWDFACRTPFYERLLAEKQAFGEEGRRRDNEAGVQLRRSAEQIIRSDRSFRAVLAGNAV